MKPERRGIFLVVAVLLVSAVLGGIYGPNVRATTASTDDYQSAVSSIESAWDQVETDAGDLKDVSTSTLDSSWDSFKSAVDDVPDDASVSDALTDVSQAATSLASTTKATLTGPDCSSS